MSTRPHLTSAVVDHTQTSRIPSGFTLIELLLVISILSLLIALLLPTLSSARQAGRRIICLNQTRSITFGSLMFAEDHQEYLPLALSQVKPPYGWWITHLRRAGYVQDGVLACPNSLQDTLSGAVAGQTPVPLTYGPSPYVFGYNTTGGPNLGPFQLSQWQQPARTLAMAEGFFVSGLSRQNNAENPYHVFTLRRSTVSFRHDEQSNVAWLDGHATTADFQTLGELFYWNGQ